MTLRELPKEVTEWAPSVRRDSLRIMHGLPRPRSPAVKLPAPRRRGLRQIVEAAARMLDALNVAC
jgi:hypothetical protein